MNPLASQKNPLQALKIRFFFIILIVFSAFSLCSCQAAGHLENEPTRNSPASAYGVKLSGFTPAQEALIIDTLDAYAQALGGPAELRKIFLRDNNGRMRPVVYDPSFTGANTHIRLSPTVFSLELADAANYSCYAAASEEMHAQIVIGHEIAHILVRAALARTSIDWVRAYEQRVSRDWAALGNPNAANEEAVTELSLKVLGAGYYFSMNPDEPETDARILSEIDAWAEDFLTSLNEME